jgi:hypothetical protein
MSQTTELNRVKALAEKTISNGCAEAEAIGQRTSPQVMRTRYRILAMLSANPLVHRRRAPALGAKASARRSVLSPMPPHA